MLKTIQNIKFIMGFHGPITWGYGLSPLRVVPAVRKTVELFDQIYQLQDSLLQMNGAPKNPKIATMAWLKHVLKACNSKKFCLLN